MSEETQAPRRLADRFWLLAHDGNPVQPVVGPAALALGCAGALLGELLLDRAISLRPAVQPRHVDRPCGDRLCVRLRSEVAAESGHDLRTWLSYLALQAPGWVRARLVLDGLLEESVGRAGTVRPVSYPVWSVVGDEQRRVRHELTTALRAPGYVLGGTGMITVPEDVVLVLLAGLAQATGLLQQVARPRTAEQVELWCQRVPERLTELVSTATVLVAESATR